MLEILILHNSNNQLKSILEVQEIKLMVLLITHKCHILHLLLCSKEMINCQIQVLQQLLLFLVEIILTSLLWTISKELLDNLELISILELIWTLLNYNITHSTQIWVTMLILSCTNPSILLTLMLVYLETSCLEIKSGTDNLSSSVKTKCLNMLHMYLFQ